MRSTSVTLLGWLVLPAAVLCKLTVRVSNVEPLPLDSAGIVSSSTELFHQSCPEEVANKNPYTAQVLLSSYTKLNAADEQHGLDQVYPSSDSFVRGSIVAWANHQSLVLRPDVIWFEILAQLNFYMTANAESLRHLFVDFEGKEEIVVQEASWHAVIASFGGAIQRLVKTDWLLDWVTPGFSTSTENDNMTATVLTMGLMQHYFEFAGVIFCGIPSVTLLGRREDWVKLHEKLDRLAEWGAEPTQYANNLRPILGRFVRTWDEPNSPATRSFWEQIVRAKQQLTCGGPTKYDITGWITGFAHWREDGRLIRNGIGWSDEGNVTTLDGVSYPRLDVTKLPVGYAKAPLKMIDYPVPGVNTTAYVLAGNIGIKRTVNGNGNGNGNGKKEVSAEPLNSWFLYGPVDVNYKTGPEYGNFSDVETLVQPLGGWCPAASWFWEGRPSWSRPDRLRLA
ncbi:hypothetical protein E4U43_003555 [Claviceps pusilla]|uniref:Uncharacterized protein n=1 Tax=Claviceps pusilla TaxID=123648 RepID=A0A9P7N782_9HYPO|nr:hypothetical protein E4U43_003555 [Claviceps pusilla]